MRHPWKSTKLHLALIAMALMTWAYWRAAGDQFSNYCMWLTAAAGIYSSSSAAEKFVKPTPPAAG